MLHISGFQLLQTVKHVSNAVKTRLQGGSYHLRVRKPQLDVRSVDVKRSFVDAARACKLALACLPIRILCPRAYVAVEGLFSPCACRDAAGCPFSQTHLLVRRITSSNSLRFLPRNSWSSS